MSIQILPLPSPLPDDFTILQNNILVDWYSGDNAFRNGRYLVSSSSYNNDRDPFNLIDGNDNTYWSSGVTNSINNIESVKYINNPYDNSVPASFISGNENNKNKPSYWKTNATHIQNSKIDIYGEWIQFELPYKIYLTKYIIKPVNDYPNQSPYKFALLCSNNGIDWSVIDIRTAPASNTFIINNVLKSNYYRIVISQVKGSTNEKIPVSIQGIELYGTNNIIKSTETFINYSTYSNSIPCGSCGITPLKNSTSTADEFSSKLPGTDLYGAPSRGADSNLHWYKAYSKNEIISTNKILENFQIEREPFSLSGNVDLNTTILYDYGNSFIAKRDELLNNSLYDYSGNILYKNNGVPTLADGLQDDVNEYSTQEKNVFILGTISVAIVAIGFIVIATSE